MSAPKQIIVVRKDLKMRMGKVAAQVAHASMGVLLKLGERRDSHDEDGRLLRDEFALPLYIADYGRPEHPHMHRKELMEWLDGAFTKICVYVNSEEELDALHDEAAARGIINCMIIDNGRTEFHGVKTKTCLAIGPATPEQLEFTKHLPLL